MFLIVGNTIAVRYHIYVTHSFVPIVNHAWTIRIAILYLMNELINSSTLFVYEFNRHAPLSLYITVVSLNDFGFTERSTFHITRRNSTHRRAIFFFFLKCPNKLFLFFPIFFFFFFISGTP